jgi:hypothetical protein
MLVLLAWLVLGVNAVTINFVFENMLRGAQP